MADLVCPAQQTEPANLIPGRFPNSTILAFLALAVYYTILQLFRPIKFFPTESFFISSMGTTLPNDLEARIASAVVAAVQQAILEAKVAAAVERALRSHPHSFYSPAFKPASEPAVEPAAEPVYEPVFEPAAEPICEPVHEHAPEPASEPAEQKKQPQLPAPKQSLPIAAGSAILIQSHSPYHASYSHRSFHPRSANQGPYHHGNQFRPSYYGINKPFQMYGDGQNAIYDPR